MIPKDSFSGEGSTAELTCSTANTESLKLKSMPSNEESKNESDKSSHHTDRTSD